ncbi:glycosyltransferase family 4 protein [Gaopeijia maritima]|uniref:Glycosyltransferase family 1 protein n=1 Tax=Gaopeijia maritima TaxID=3119007 RepID=A0ABU9EAW7_9BACT
MRIALFTDTCFPTVNGVARALGLLVDHANAAGHEVALVSPDLGAPHPGVAFQVRLPGVTLPFYRELKAARPWMGARDADVLEAFAPDVVHVATEALVGSVGRRWARARGIPLITSFCTNFPDYLSGYHMGFAEEACWSWLRRFHAAADLTVCPSHATRKDLAERGFHERLKIWGRGVDAELFHPSRRDPALRASMAPDAEVVLLYVGRIAPEKKVELLVEAFPEIRARSEKTVALVFVGGGPALEPLRERAPEGVHFAGYQRGEALARHYASADVFLFGSDTETFGQVVTEALSSGLPVVAPARGGVTDTVIPGETGFLFEPGNARALADHAVRLVNDDALRERIGARAREMARARSWAAVFETLFRDYAEACAGRYGAVTDTSDDRRAVGATLGAEARR